MGNNWVVKAYYVLGSSNSLKARVSLMSWKLESEGSRMLAKNAGGQAPVPPNRNHIVGRIGTDECAVRHKVW